jgi:hypothetical protein
MRSKRFGAAVAAFALLSAPALAAPVTMEGDFIKVGVNDRGTLGSGGSTSPGLLHDNTGTKNFGVNDYITPGTPHESFAIVSDQTGFLTNDNAGGSPLGFASPTFLVGPAAMGYDNAVTWTGNSSFTTITNSYFFNNGDERILIETKILALSDLTNLAFGRSVDPDPDVNTFGSFATNNQRGNSIFALEDFVGAAGPSTGLTLALINLNGTTYARNSYIGGGCCSQVNPYTILAGGGMGNASFGDHSLNMAWNIGSLKAGESATIRYAYAVGDKIDLVGGGGVIPEPGTWAMMIFGFGIVGAALRRRLRLTIA